MAIIGKLKSLKHLFVQNQDLESIYAYLYNALNKSSEIHKRILNTPLNSENKLNLTADIFFIEQSYMSKNPKNAFFESHKKYIDFQFVLSGVEYFEIGDSSDFTIKTPYIETKDLIVYEESPKTSKIRLDSGMLAIFFQSDVHAGGLCYDTEQQKISKTVIKVPNNLINLKL